MKRGLISGIVIAVIIIAVIAFFILNNKPATVNNLPTFSSSTANHQNINAIEISNFAFSPQTVTLNAGDSISWINKDSAPHTITSNSGKELVSSSLASGQSYSHTFNVVGTYEYHCSIHTTMKGVIIVK